MAQMILYICRDTNLKVMNILNDISKREDVTEFVTTIQLVQITINNLLKSKKEFKFELLKDLQNSLKDYENLLVQLNGTGKLLRFVTSNRLRRKIEQVNSSIHARLEQLRETIKDTAPSSPALTASTNSSVQSPLQKTISRDNLSDASASEIESANEDEIEASVKLSLMIEDQDGKQLWSELFGLNAFMVEWAKFLAGLKKILTDIKEDEAKALQYVIDNSNTGYVNQHKFSEFLKGFGPVQDCIKNLKSIMSARWFYGFLSRVESELLLRDQIPGSFLIRFSSSQPGSFALAFSTVQKEDKPVVCHILINSCKPHGYQIHEQQNKDARTFQHLYEIVDFYSVFLQRPFASELPFESWFEGDASNGETVEMLTGHKPGTFLVRFSVSQPGAYAISFVESDGRIIHSLVEHENIQENGYRISNNNEIMVFKSLKDVVSFYGEALKFPVKALTNDLVVEVTKHILTWKKDREKQMEAVERIVNELFDPHKELESRKPLDAPKEIEQKVEAIISRLFTPIGS